VIVRRHVDHIKSRQSSSDNVVSEDDFYSISDGNHSEVNSAPFADPQNNIEPRRSSRQRCHLSVTVMTSNLKVEGDVVTEH